jgi:tRNA G18 (ribose-2'-O)-methylase SpoU
VTEIILIAHNLRSCHNVGSLLRTADGLGIDMVYLTGYTPYPSGPASDGRLPHLAAKINRQISKTALGAEKSQAWQHEDDIKKLLKALKNRGYVVAALEQAKNSEALPDYSPPSKIALLVGREVEGVEPEVLAQADKVLEIPMTGQKESFNVAIAAAIGLYHLRYF